MHAEQWWIQDLEKGFQTLHATSTLAMPSNSFINDAESAEFLSMPSAATGSSAPASCDNKKKKASHNLVIETCKLVK